MSGSESGGDGDGRVLGPDGNPTAAHEEVDFAPFDPTDGREEEEWGSRYTDRRAIIQISLEAIYVGVLLGAFAFALLLVWIGTPQTWLGVNDARYETFHTYADAWLAGALGGTLFSIKWLYHSVARGIWHVDRLLWRLFIPHLSGAFAFSFIALITSGIFEVLNRDLLRSSPAAVGLGFLLGYFSDFTVARLYRIARDLFGSPHEEKRPSEEDESSPKVQAVVKTATQEK